MLGTTSTQPCSSGRPVQMALGPRASLLPPVAEIPVVAPVALIVAFPVEGSLVGGCSVELPPNWAGYPPLLTGWVEIPPVLGMSA